MVQQRLGHRLHSSLDHHGLVDRALRESSDAAPEEPELIVRVESAVADPGAPEQVASRDPVSVGGAARPHDRADTLLQLGRDPLVGIEGQSPLARRLIQCEVLLGGEARPRPDPDPVREIPRDLHGLVRRLGVDDDDLVGPRDALEAGAEPVLLVPGDDRDADAAHAAPSSMARAAPNAAPTSRPVMRPSGLWSPRQPGP